MRDCLLFASRFVTTIFSLIFYICFTCCCYEVSTPWHVKYVDTELIAFRASFEVGGRISCSISSSSSLSRVQIFSAMSSSPSASAVKTSSAVWFSPILDSADWRDDGTLNYFIHSLAVERPLYQNLLQQENSFVIQVRNFYTRFYSWRRNQIPCFDKKAST